MFSTTFFLTTAAVLLVWQLTTPDKVVDVPRVEIVHVDRFIPVPVPVPAVTIPPFDNQPMIAPPARTQGRVNSESRSSASDDAPSASERVVVDVTEPVVATLPVPAPKPVLAAPIPAAVSAPQVPVKIIATEARVLSGGYSGKVDGKSVHMTFWFGHDGVVSVSIAREDGPRIDAAGTYEMVGSKARVVLVERGVEGPLGYTGTVGPAGAEGRVTQSGKNVGKFTLQK